MSSAQFAQIVVEQLWFSYFSTIAYGLGYSLKVPRWGNHNISFHGEIIIRHCFHYNVESAHDKMKFHGISELMLATRDLLNLYRLLGVTFYDCINTIYQFIKSFLDKKNVYFWGIWSLKRNKKGLSMSNIGVGKLWDLHRLTFVSTFSHTTRNHHISCQTTKLLQNNTY